MQIFCPIFKWLSVFPLGYFRKASWYASSVVSLGIDRSVGRITWTSGEGNTSLLWTFWDLLWDGYMHTQHGTSGSSLKLLHTTRLKICHTYLHFTICIVVCRADLFLNIAVCSSVILDASMQKYERTHGLLIVEDWSAWKLKIIKIPIL